MSARDDEEQELIALAEEIVWRQWRIERILAGVGWPDHDHDHVYTWNGYCAVCGSGIGEP